MSDELEKPQTEQSPQALSQAERVFKKFGGARKLAGILLLVGKPRDPASLYKWTYPRGKGGTGGLIPTSAWADVLLAARYAGVLIDAELTDPRTFVPKRKFKNDDTWE